MLPLLLSLWVDGVDSVTSQLQSIGWSELGVIAYLAFLSTLLGYGLWTRLLQRYAASTVALVAAGAGDRSAVGHAAAGEAPNGLQWLGTLGVLLGMVVNQFGGKWRR
jgi:O-acetylserine/cysteine efflux transporter